MNRRSLLLAALTPVFTSPRVWAAPGGMPVVASFTILADLVAQVGGEAVAVGSLVAADGDAHIFQARPSDLVRLKGAAVLVENGLGLEPWLARMVRSSGFAGKRVVASAGVKPRNFDEAGKVVTDPHCWQDPRNAASMVGVIAAALAAADPAHADGYRARGEAFAREILAEDAAIEQAFAGIPAPKRQIITSHDAFGYYGARYGIVFRGVQGINTDAEPTPRDLARLAAQIRSQGIRAVFVENMTDPRIAEALAREAGAIVGGKVYSDSLSPADGPAATYLAMLRHNTALFADAMRRQ